MKKLIFILPWLIMLSCNNSSGAGNNSVTPKSDAVSASVNPAADKGTITCTIDGKSQTFRVHKGFTGIRLESDSKGPNDGFMLLDGNATNEGFQFEIKNKGTSVFEGMDGILNMFYYYNSSGVIYVAHKNATASVTSFEGNHLTGSFSGKFEHSTGLGPLGSSPESIEITDGKFDLNK